MQEHVDCPEGAEAPQASQTIGSSVVRHTDLRLPPEVTQTVKTQLTVR